MSDSPKLPRADAKLKRLSEAVQARIMEMCAQPGMKQTDVLKWIKDECDVRSSPAALSEFLSWYAARKEARQNEARVSAFLDEERNLHPELTDEQLFERGQRAFSLLAIARQDAKEWTSVQKVGIDKASSQTDRAKFKRETCELFLEWSADEQAKAIAGSGSTHEEKLRALDQAMFPEDWGK